MVNAVQRGELVADHVRGPVLRHTGTNQAVERQRGRPHHVGAVGVHRLRRSQDTRPHFNQRLQNALGEAVLHQRVDGVGQVLLRGVHKGINHAVGQLLRRQRVGLGRVQHRKARKAVGTAKGQLGALGAVRDDGAVVHLRAGGRQRQHGAERHGPRDVAPALFQNAPGVALDVHRCRDELDGVDHRAAAHGEQEIEAALTNLLHGAQRRFVAGIGLDARERRVGARAQGLAHLGQRAVLLGAGAAHQDQYTRLRGHQAIQVGHAALAKGNVGRVVKVKIQHRAFHWVKTSSVARFAKPCSRSCFCSC